MSQEIVEQAKADLVGAGKDLSGNNGAFLITMEAASRVPGAGVLDKPTGNHAEFQGGSYAVDIIAFPDGRIVDVLIDAGGANTPTWDDSKAPVDPSRFRRAVSVLKGGRPDVPPTDVTPATTIDLAPVIARVDAMQARLDDLAAGVARVEGLLADLRAALQATDDHVERIYQDLVNRISRM